MARTAGVEGKIVVEPFFVKSSSESSSANGAAKIVVVAGR
jgi:hypothetical protein